jgi:hypothetical protein
MYLGPLQTFDWIRTHLLEVIRMRISVMAGVSDSSCLHTRGVRTALYRATMFTKGK